jgi:hypothetical protein
MIRHHVIDQPVLVGEPLLIERLFELGLVDMLENVREAAVTGFQDRILGREIQRPTTRKA